MYGFWAYVYVILCCVLQLCLGGIVVNLLEYPFDPSLILQKKRSLKRELSKKEGLIPKKIALLSGSTIGEVKNILELFLLENGIQPTFYEGGYSLFYENIVFDDGSLANFQPDFIYIHTSWRNLKNLPSQMDSPELCQQKLDAEYSRFEQVWKAAQKFGCPIIQNNFDLPVYRVMGNLDAVDVHGKVRFIRKLNDKMAEYATTTPIFTSMTWHICRQYMAWSNFPAKLHGMPINTCVPLIAFPTWHKVWQTLSKACWAKTKSWLPAIWTTLFGAVSLEMMEPKAL